jgi:uncharacterized protein YjcR
MTIDGRTRKKLIRILKLMGSDQPGERSSAAHAADKLVASLGTDWETLLAPQAEPKVVVQRVHEWDVNHREAAEARIRQLKETTERQARQIRGLRTRVNSLVDRERKRRATEDVIIATES